jgi:CHAT domain-containing protein
VLTLSAKNEAALAASIERATVLLERSSPNEAWQPELARLYDWLIRPVAEMLGPAGTELRIIPDDAAATAPYAALFDGVHYFIERHSIVVADHIATVMSDRQASATTQRPVIVAAPAQTAFPALQPLVFADSEASWLSHRYPQGLVLRGADADSATVLKALAGATLFHFAGHAVYDESRPERSALAIGAHGVTATAIAAADLSRLELAVLSACDVMRGSVRAEGGSNGLTDAFLAAGAHGVLGAVWAVDDAASDRLIREFYKRYAVSGDAATALWAAQLSLVAEPPSTWGAFRYAER